MKSKRAGFTTIQQLKYELKSILKSRVANKRVTNSADRFVIQLGTGDRGTCRYRFEDYYLNHATNVEDVKVSFYGNI